MSITSDLSVHIEHPTVTFTYDGDGNRVKKDEDSVVTHYPGRHYESTIGSGSTKYYYAGGQLIAFERSPEYGINYGRRFVFRDHLGSTSVIVNDKGEKLWEDRFYPFGDVRYTYRKGDDPSFPLQTQYRYTSQWFEDGLGASAEDGLDRGLYFYGARWYDASLGRFVQPDTIVPEPGNPQALNRYTYANNNALRYADPSGYTSCSTDWCWKNRWYNAHGYFSDGGHWSRSGPAGFADEQILLETLGEASIRFDNGFFGLSQWTFSEMALVGQGVVALANKVGGLAQLHRLLGGGTTTFERVGISGGRHFAAFVGFGRVQISGVYQNWISVFNNAFGNQNTPALIVHELAHVIDFNLRIDVALPGGGAHAVSPSSGFPHGPHITNYAISNDIEYWAEAVTDWVFGTAYKGPYENTARRIREALTADQSDWILRVLSGQGW